MIATPLGTKAIAGKGDQREVLAKWITAPDNPFFARNLTNRCGHTFWVAAVRPVDDSIDQSADQSNCSTPSPKFVDSRFDVKAMVRLVCNSRVYQTSSRQSSRVRDDQKKRGSVQAAGCQCSWT